MFATCTVAITSNDSKLHLPQITKKDNYWYWYLVWKLEKLVPRLQTFSVDIRQLWPLALHQTTLQRQNVYKHTQSPFNIIHCPTHEIWLADLYKWNFPELLKTSYPRTQPKSNSCILDELLIFLNDMLQLWYNRSANIQLIRRNTEKCCFNSNYYLPLTSTLMLSIVAFHNK